MNTANKKTTINRAASSSAPVWATLRHGLCTLTAKDVVRIAEQTASEYQCALQFPSTALDGKTTWSGQTYGIFRSREQDRSGRHVLYAIARDRHGQLVKLTLPPTPDITVSALYSPRYKLLMYSSHRHDYVAHGEGSNITAIDGGRDYLRCVGTLAPDWYLAKYNVHLHTATYQNRLGAVQHVAIQTTGHSRRRLRSSAAR